MTHFRLHIFIYRRMFNCEMYNLLAVYEVLCVKYIPQARLLFGKKWHYHFLCTLFFCCYSYFGVCVIFTQECLPD